MVVQIVAVDILALQDLYKRSGVDWTASSYNNCKSYYRYVNGKLVGYCLLLNRSNTICNLVVDKEYRGLGIASALLKQAISEGGKYLGSLKYNVAFYVNRGFKVYGVSYHPEFKDNLYYMKYLNT
jgi:ribosomal protein S18 acetylase RimI-like enzyme